MGKIYFENSIYTFEHIRQGLWKERDLYFHQALTFAQQWLLGQESFEIGTSGSTGKPKNIQIQRAQMKASALATKEYFRIEYGSKILCCLNTWMIAGKMMIVRGMEWDAEIYLIKPVANPLQEAWLPLDLAFAAMVPMQVQACLDQENSLNKLKHIENLIIGGAPSSGALIEELKANQINAFQTFGMTETVSHIALANISEEALLYKTLPGVEIGTDEQSRLWLKGPMTGFRTIQTNDIVDILNPGQFHWLGRADFVINSGGVKVYPEIVEDKIQGIVFEHFGSTNYFISALPDAKLGQKVILIVEGESPNVSFEGLTESMKRVVNRYHLPKEVIFLPKFVYTASGKINRTETIKLLK